jgi:hypothetical protein
MDSQKQPFPRHHRRSGSTKINCHILAVETLEIPANIALERQAAPLAKGRGDPAHIVAAGFANKTLGGRGSEFPAKLANFRINQAQAGIPCGAREVAQGAAH